MLKVLLCLAAVFAASTNAYAGVTCQRMGNYTYCQNNNGGGSVTCQQMGSYTYCN